MKTKHFVLALTCLLTFCNFSTSVAQQKSLYYEGFSSGDSWPIGNNDTRKLEIKNGKYYFEHKRESKSWTVKTRVISFDTQKDFEIETRVQRISGTKSNAFGLIFGTKNTDNTFHFILGREKYRVSKKVNGKFIKIKEWTKSSSINQAYYSYNKLKVKKVGKRLSFYINGDFVTSMDFQAFFGKKIGILVYNKQKITVDYFKVNQTSSSTTKTTTASKKILFEGFNSNSNNWTTSNTSDASVQVSNGDLIINHKKSSGGWAPTISKYVDTSRDFRITGRFKKVKGVNNGFGLAFGRKDSQNQNQFFISSNGSYIINKSVNGKRTYIKNWTESSYIKTGNGAKNNLKVQKKGSAYKFYINNNLVYTSYSVKFYGDKIGFIVYDKQKIAVEYLSMYYEDDKKTTPAVTNITTKKTTVSKTILFEGFNNTNNNWPSTDSSDNYAIVNGGDYLIEHKVSSGGFAPTISKYIDPNRNFRISAQIKKINGSTNGFGLTFGRKDADNQNQFFISSSGSYIINKTVNGKRTYIKNWTESSYIKKGNGVYNTLKVQKEDNKFKFYINNNLVHTSYSTKFYGDRVGFIVYDKIKISVGYLSLAYEDNKTTVIKKNENIVATGEYALQEYFNSNKNGWSTGTNEDKVTSVANSYFNFEHKKSTGGWSTYITSTIDTSRDFEISSKIKKVSGITNYAYGILWGKKGTSSFRFYVSGSGYYKISRLVDNKEEIIKKFTKTSALKTGNDATNLLTINKVGNKYKFYANGTFLTQADFEPFFGNQIGYSVFNKQKISADRLIVKYLKKKKDAVVTNNILKTPLSESFTDNTNGWYLTDNANKKTRVENGKLYIKNNSESSGAFISKEIDIDTSRDFIIETSLTRLTSSATGSIAFSFGRKNNTNEFDLFLSIDSYLFRKLEKDSSTKLIPWTASDLLNQNTHQANKIKIVKSNNLLRFYINDQYVNEAPYSDFFGKYVGFSVYNKQEISVDYLNITYPSASYNTPPEVVILEPTVQRGFKIVKTKRILVRGKATDKDGIFEVIINGIDARLSEDGSFTANVPLKIGTNDLIVKATDIKQATSTKKFVIKRKSPDVVDPVVVVNKDKDLNIGFGEYYALLIGVSDYGDGAIQDLGGLPTKDAQDLANVLVTKYNFKKENVVVLNKSPKANDIIKEFSKLKKKVTNKDNLLVFYAGHGVYDEVSQIGHWLPSDADMEYELNLISNSQVVDFLKGIQSKHTLLVSDACFSGSIFKTRSFEKSPKSIQKKYELTSRKAITSGTLKTVPNKSMFLKYLLKRLENNQNKYLSARKLFDRIEEPVMNNSPNTPQYGTIFGIGDEGGDFIFIKN